MLSRERLLKKTAKFLPFFGHILQERDGLRARVRELLRQNAELTDENERLREMAIRASSQNFAKGLDNGSAKGVFENFGYCYSCNSVTRFVASGNWWREQYLCINCGSIPRERALMYCVERFFPHWRKCVIHESSPVMRGTVLRLKTEAAHYIPTYYYPDVKLGSIYNGYRCEDLESLTFENNSIDLHITQDVVEHVFNPAKVFTEIYRTLKPGGMHIFTVPLVNKHNPTEMCARLLPTGDIHYLREPEYHGNPIDEKGSLVVARWGYDIVDFIYKHTGMMTKIVLLDALELGIRAEYIEVLVSSRTG